MQIPEGPEFLFLHCSKVASKQSRTTCWSRDSVGGLIFPGLMMREKRRNAEFELFCRPKSGSSGSLLKVTCRRLPLEETSDGRKSVRNQGWSRRRGQERLPQVGSDPVLLKPVLTTEAVSRTSARSSRLQPAVGAS